jgi:hypothetical protein
VPTAARMLMGAGYCAAARSFERMSGGEICSDQPTDVVSSAPFAFIPWRCQKIAEEYRSESMAPTGSETGPENTFQRCAAAT